MRGNMLDRIYYHIKTIYLFIIEKQRWTDKVTISTTFIYLKNLKRNWNGLDLTNKGAIRNRKRAMGQRQRALWNKHWTIEVKSNDSRPGNCKYWDYFV